jgi:hypothetical protein
MTEERKTDLAFATDSKISSIDCGTPFGSFNYYLGRFKCGCCFRNVFRYFPYKHTGEYLFDSPGDKFDPDATASIFDDEYLISELHF